jgi:hypothetical protein
MWMGYLRFRAGEVADHVYSTLSDHAQNGSERNFVWLLTRFRMLSGSSSLSDHSIRYAVARLALVLVIQHSARLSNDEVDALLGYTLSLNSQADLDPDEKRICALLLQILGDDQGLLNGLHHVTSSKDGRRSIYDYSLILDYKDP